MSILLTGGCGFIGSHCALILLEYGYDIIIVDNLLNSSKDMIDKIQITTGKKILFYNLDINDEIKLDAVFSAHKIDTVIHFAAHKSVNESVLNPLKYYLNNIGGLLTLLKIMEIYSVNKIIFSSSATVYSGNSLSPLTENSPVSPMNPYGKTKYFSEEILKDFKNIKTICLRYFNPVGAYSPLFIESPKEINNLFPYILSVIKKENEYLSIYGNDYQTRDGTCIRDYIHVVDLAKGHLAALKHLDFVNFEIFNLGTGKGLSVLEIVETFSKKINKKIPYKIIERRPGDLSETYADCSKALEILNWKAELNLNDMIDSLINFKP